MNDEIVETQDTEVLMPSGNKTSDSSTMTT
jgi:hypothetical protein